MGDSWGVVLRAGDVGGGVTGGHIRDSSHSVGDAGESSEGGDVGGAVIHTSGGGQESPGGDRSQGGGRSQGRGRSSHVPGVSSIAAVDREAGQGGVGVASVGPGIASIASQA